MGAPESITRDGGALLIRLQDNRKALSAAVSRPSPPNRAKNEWKQGKRRLPDLEMAHDYFSGLVAGLKTGEICAQLASVNKTKMSKYGRDRQRLFEAAGGHQFPIRIRRLRIPGKCPDIGNFRNMIWIPIHHLAFRVTGYIYLL